MRERRRGVLLALAAYGIWGLFPLYWPLLEPAGPLEILAHRCLWSLAVVVVALAVRRDRAFLAPLLADRRRLAMLALAAVAIAVNWGVYIYGVNSGQVIETALGYFVNPLVTVLLGVVVLGERLPRAQVAALGLAGVAVVVLTVAYGRLPWIALVLAVSFGGYGLLKKTVGVAALPGLAVETTVLFVPAVVALAVLSARGDGSFTRTPGHALLLASTGLVTAVPLLLFAGGAPRIPLTTLGVLQYVTPTLQFAVGVLVRHESLPAANLAGFVLVWVALGLFTASRLRERRRGPVPAAQTAVARSAA